MSETTMAISQMLTMFEELRYSKPVTKDRVKLWDVVLSKHRATPGEIQQMAGLGVSTLKDYPVPAEGLELLHKVRDENLQIKLGSLVRARAELGYTVLTPPEQVLDGNWVGGNTGNGIPLDELSAARVERGLPARSTSQTLSLRARLKSVAALVASNKVTE